MRYDKDNTRRIGGLLLDLLMLSFIISFSLADVKITDGYEDTSLAFSSSSTDHRIVKDFDSLFGGFVKHISKTLPEYSQSLGSIIEFACLKDPKIVVFTSSSYLYNSIYTNTTINAP